MTISLRANEFSIYTAVSHEMREALDQGDHDAARQAAEELEAIAIHTDWQLIRHRCNKTLSEYERHISGKGV